MKNRNIAAIALLACVLALSCCVSCRTAEPQIEYVYVEPTYPDIKPSMELLFDSRPNNEEQMKLLPKEQVDTSLKLLYNSWEYQCAWERWEDYAINLEDFIKGVAEELDSLS